VLLVPFVYTSLIGGVAMPRLSILKGNDYMPEIPGGKFKKIREKKATEERRKANIAYNRTRTDKDLVSLYGTQRWKKLRRMIPSARYARERERS
jgi:hypothetical protein